MPEELNEENIQNDDWRAKYEEEGNKRVNLEKMVKKQIEDNNSAQFVIEKLTQARVADQVKIGALSAQVEVLERIISGALND